MVLCHGTRLSFVYFWVLLSEALRSWMDGFDLEKIHQDHVTCPSKLQEKILWNFAIAVP